VTATSDRRLRRGALVVALVAVALAGTLIARGAGRAAAFDWLRPAPPPRGWARADTAAGATLAYPARWRPLRSDRGAVSAALTASRGTVVGYLNATPRNGTETLSNWRSFRPAHDAEEGDRRVRVEAFANGLRLRSGHGACVIDTYSTRLSRYREIACIVAGSHGTTVVVGAAPPARWAAEAPAIERAIAAFAA
jgi:hypothetical protein